MTKLNKNEIMENMVLTIGDDEVSLGSSIPEVIKNMATELGYAIENAENAENAIEEDNPVSNDGGRIFDNMYRATGYYYGGGAMNTRSNEELLEGGGENGVEVKLAKCRIQKNAVARFHIEAPFVGITAKLHYAGEEPTQEELAEEERINEALQEANVNIYYGARYGNTSAGFSSGYGGGDIVMKEHSFNGIEEIEESRSWRMNFVSKGYEEKKVKDVLQEGLICDFVAINTLPRIHGAYYWQDYTRYIFQEGKGNYDRKLLLKINEFNLYELIEGYESLSEEDKENLGIQETYVVPEDQYYEPESMSEELYRSFLVYALHTVGKSYTYDEIGDEIVEVLDKTYQYDNKADEGGFTVNAYLEVEMEEIRNSTEYSFELEFKATTDHNMISFIDGSDVSNSFVEMKKRSACIDHIYGHDMQDLGKIVTEVRSYS